MQVFDLIENQSQRQKRFDVKVFKDGSWYVVGSVYTDSPWLVAWVKECLEKSPPKTV